MKIYRFFLLLSLSVLLLSCEKSEADDSSSYVNTGSVVNYGSDCLEVAGQISKIVYAKGLYPTEYGIVYSPDRNSLDVGNDGNRVVKNTNTYGALTDFCSKLSGLVPNRTYYYRAYIYIAGIYYYGSTKSANTNDLKFSNVNIEYQRLTYWRASGQRKYTYRFSCDLSETISNSVFYIDYHGAGSDLRTLDFFLNTNGKKINDDFEIYFTEGDYTYNKQTKTYSTKGMKVNMSVCLQDYFNKNKYVPVYSFSVILPE